jgi:N-ethylmaleimide reductase
MTAADIAHAVDEYAKSAQLAVEAGFDGVELHAANGYLIEQFLNAHVNERTDAYGGSIEGRNRFALEVSRATAAAIGAHRVGIRLSPYGVFNGTGVFPDVDAQHLALWTAEDMAGKGAAHEGARWNHAGEHVTYAATSVSLAAWETRAHFGKGARLPWNRRLR